MTHTNRSANKSLTPKFTWLVAVARNVSAVRRHPGCLVRRLDFIPLSELACAIPQTVVDFALASATTPPVQLWAGHADLVSGMSLPQLLTFYVRWLRDQCWAALQGCGIAAAHRAVVFPQEPWPSLLSRLPCVVSCLAIMLKESYSNSRYQPEECDVLRLLSQPDARGPSAFKGCVVWVALSSNLRQALGEAEEQDIFYKRFAAGSLHLVESCDVTNTKLKVKPMVQLPPPPPSRSEQGGAGGAVPEPEGEPPMFPGASMLGQNASCLACCASICLQFHVAATCQNLRLFPRWWWCSATCSMKCGRLCVQV